MNPLGTCVLLTFFLGLGSSSFGQVPTWTPTGAPSNAWSTIACSADGTQVVAATGGLTANGQIYTSTNSGTNWSPTTAPSLHWLSVASSADGSKLIAAADGNGIYTSTNAGANWVSNSIAGAGAPFSPQWYSVACSADGSKLFALLYGDLFFHSTNSGAVWLPSTNHLADGISVAATADGTLVIGGSNHGTVATATNFGANWSTNTILFSPYTVNVPSLCASAQGERLFAMVFGEGLSSSTNRGLTWFTNKTLPSASSWNAVACSADGTKITAAGQKALLYSSTDSGATWVSNSAPPTVYWQALASSADGNVVFAAPQNGSIWVRRTTPSPALKISSSIQGPLVSWIIPSATFILQQGASLDSPGWTDLTNPPVLNLANLQNQIIITPTNSTALYRLRSP